MTSVFAQWLDITLSNRKISGRELAQCAGVHDSAISKYRTGQATPGMKTVVRLAHALCEDPMRMAATVGLIDPEEFGVQPLELPTDTARREAARKRIAALPGLTKKTRQRLLVAYDEIITEDREGDEKGV